MSGACTPATGPPNPRSRGPIPLPASGLRRHLAQVPVQRRPAHSEIFGDVLPVCPSALHSPSRRDVLGVVDFSGPTELGAIGAGWRPLEGGSLA